MRRIAIAVVASTMSLSLAGCGMLGASENSSSATPTRSNDVTVGVLMPEETNTRYADFDYPIIKKKVAELTENKGRTEYANAAGEAKTQLTQMQKMIDEKGGGLRAGAARPPKHATRGGPGPPPETPHPPTHPRAPPPPP
ncbi:hypothetical protein ACFV4T_32605, partial [Streptomyces sp. NPDC059755]